MKEKIKKIFIYFIILNCFIVNIYGKGSMTVNIRIDPFEKTKKYDTGQLILIDAGILNSQSNTGRIKLGTVTVEMLTKQTDHGANIKLGIPGEFNEQFNLSSLSTFTNVPLTTIKKYKGGETAKMDLKIENLQIITKILTNGQVPTGDAYLFVAYPNEVTPALPVNPLSHLVYSFDLYLEVSGVNSGDIIKRDIRTMAEGEAEAIGSMQDIIKAQFYPNKGI